VTSATVIWHNLWRNKLRTALTIASVAVSLFLFTVLRAVVDSMDTVAASSARQLRLVVHHKTTMTKTLPLAHGAKIAALPGVEALCAVRWFGGKLPNSAAQFPSLAADPDNFTTVYADFALRPDEIAAWRTERTAAIIGAGLAQRMGWSRGQRVTLRSTVPPYVTLEFRIVGITAASAYPNLLVLRLDYLLDAVRADPRWPPGLRDVVHFYWVKARSPAAYEMLRGAIDGLFAQSADATRTEPEESFVAQFTMMFGDIPRLVSVVGLVVVVSIILVVTNTMAMSIRERVRELGVLRAIGFPGRRILATVLGESLLVGVLGGAIGCLPALAVSGRTNELALMMPYFPVLTVSPRTLGVGLAVAVLIGLLAGLPPARAVLRVPVSTTLRE